MWDFRILWLLCNYLLLVCVRGKPYQAHQGGVRIEIYRLENVEIRI